jgi:hypothetical protein
MSEVSLTLRCGQCQQPIEMTPGEFLIGRGVPRCPCEDRVFCEGCDEWFEDDWAWFLHVPECAGLITPQ